MGIRRIVSSCAVVAALLASVLLWASQAPAAADVPVTVIGLDAGARHTCVLLAGGAVKCWGENLSGELGYGDTISRGGAPTDMGDNLPLVDLGTGRWATAISVGANHACALLDGGDVKCWGANNYGQLGLGDTADRGDGPNEMGDHLPVVDLGTDRRATAISAGEWHTCAVLDGGDVKCWGVNNGRLGLGDTARRGDGPNEMGDRLPRVDLGSGRTATAVVAARHTCAILDHGDVKCWGVNSMGELGLGDALTRGDQLGEMGDHLPRVDLGSGRRATTLSTDSTHTCAVLEDGSVKCWGLNSNGRLGLGDTANRGDGPNEMGDHLPAVALGANRAAAEVPFGYTNVTSGPGANCVLLDHGTVKCWGRNEYGQLGLEDTQFRGALPTDMGDNLPAVQLGTGRSAVSVTAGGAHMCALLDNHTVKCWGHNWGSGVLGIGNWQDHGRALDQMGDNLPAVDLGTVRSYRIDGEVKRSTDSGYAGTGTYSDTGVDQTVASDVARGANATFDLRLTNRSTGTDSMTVFGEGNGANFPVTYRDDHGTDVTAPVVNGTYRITDVPPGHAVNMTMELGVSTGASAGDSRTVHVRVTSANDPSKSDTVGATVTAIEPIPVTTVDAEIRKATHTTYRGNGIYNTTGVDQTATTRTHRRNTTTFVIRVRNESVSPDDIFIEGTGGDAGLTVSYFVDSRNVTRAVRAGTYRFDDVAGNTTRKLKMKITVSPQATIGHVADYLVSAISANDPSVRDAVRARVTVQR